MTINKSYFFITNPNKRNELYEELLLWITNPSSLPNNTNKKIFEKSIKEKLHFSARRKKKRKLLDTKYQLEVSSRVLGNPKKEKYFLTCLTMQKILENCITPAWEQGTLSNFNYIMILNLAAGRTFKDLSQYPIFPWIISNYTKSYGELDLQDKKNYRDLSKPIGALTDERAKAANRRFQQCLEGNYCPPFNFGSHYSMPNLMFYFLIRLMPFSKLSYNLQGGRFDLSDRLFHSFPDSWKNSTSLDNQELIPEIFYLPEYLINLSNFNFGENSYQKIVNDVILPKWAYNDPRFFVKFQRKSLESLYVSSNLHHWIDLIFGYKQTGIKAKEANNIYYFLTYESNFDLSSCKNKKELKSLLEQINEYGQIPSQLFFKEHVQKKRVDKPSAFFYSPKTLKNIKPNLLFTLKNFQKKKDCCNCKNFINGINKKKNNFINKNIYEHNTGFGSFGKYCEELLYVNDYLTGVKGLIRFDDDSEFLNQFDIYFTGENYYEENSNFQNCKINWANCYDSFFLYQQEEKFQIFKHFHEKITCISTKDSNNKLIVGDVDGDISLYKFSRKKIKNKQEVKVNDKQIFTFHHSSIVENCGNTDLIFKIESKKQINLESQKSFDLFNLKFLNYKQIPKVLINGKLSSIKKSINKSKDSGKNNNTKNFTKLKVKRMSSVENIMLTSGDYSPSNSIENKLKKSPNIKEIFDVGSSKTQLQLKFVKNFKTHFAAINCLEINNSFNLLISGDFDGIICIWQIKESTLLKKIYTHHYVDQHIFKKVLIFDNSQHEENLFLSDIKNRKLDYYKSAISREKVKQISICEENGDFACISKNYVTLYSINGVILSIFHRKINEENIILPKFKHCLITTVILY